MHFLKLGSKNSPCVPTLQNYEFVSSEVSYNRAGGVAFFIKDGYDFEIRSDINILADECEDLWIEIKDLNKRSIITGVLYLHPGNSVSDFQNKFEEVIIQLNKSNKPIFITGDFNIDSLDVKNDAFVRSIANLGFNQLVNSPTRFSPQNNSFSLIDHFYSNQILNDINTKVLIHDISDHFPILVKINTSLPKSIKSKYYFKRDMKGFNSENFVNDVKLILENDFSLEEDVNKAINHFVSTFLKIIDHHAPIKKFSKREAKLQQKPWINHKLMRLIKKKNKLYKKFIKTKSLTDKNKYKEFSKTLNNLKQKSKKKHYDNLVKNSTKNSKKTWNLINNIVQLKGKKTKQIFKILAEDGTTVSESKEISEVMNNYFVNIGKKTSLPHLRLTIM